MPGNISHPIALSPNAWPNTDFGIQLHAHLEIALEDGFRDRKSARGRRVTLEANHAVVIALLGLSGGCDGRGAVDGFMQDGVFRVGVFHGAEVVRTLEQVLTLTGGIFGADGLAVDALRGETLDGCE